ncbi:MAG: hypothetical protein AB1505_37100 [Candidatus Latescibacterota bacterium]
MNRQGEEFALWIRDAHGAEGADYWGYVVLARHALWGERQFRVLVLKSHVPQKPTADLFVLQEPLRYVRAALETADAEGTDFLWSDLSVGWVVV